MPMTDEELIEQARRRQVNGHDDALDRWRLRVAARREERSMQRESKLDTNTNSEAWNAWFFDNLQSYLNECYTPVVKELAEEVGADTGRLRRDLHQLELTVARLEGELKGLREDRRSNNVVDVPRAVWKHNAA